ncbi:GtrA family protein [Sphaerisporangium sp. NPDC051011]|uniref:GtrA family protein n=1 Tax=Sphaerisporangium sp. NPDC051011 TaxID=3155792 RepID=UPI0033F12190
MSGPRERRAALAGEVAKFGAVGVVATLVDTGGFNLLHYALGWGPPAAKVAGTVAATTFAYLANRHWTWHDRARGGMGREYVLFFLLNGLALLAGLACIAFAEHVLGLRDPVSLNLANLAGYVLGTLFRFWSYRRWVFLAPA